MNKDIDLQQLAETVVQENVDMERLLASGSLIKRLVARFTNTREGKTTKQISLLSNDQLAVFVNHIEQKFAKEGVQIQTACENVLEIVIDIVINRLMINESLATNILEKFSLDFIRRIEEALDYKALESSFIGCPEASQSFIGLKDVASKIAQETETSC